MPQELCLGYFEREVQEAIEKNEPAYTRYFSALCGQQVRPVNKDGGWVPSNHPPHPPIAKD